MPTPSPLSAPLPGPQRGAGGRPRRTTTATVSTTSPPTAPLVARPTTSAAGLQPPAPFSLDSWIGDAAPIPMLARPGRFPGGLVEQAFVARALSNVQLRLRSRSSSSNDALSALLAATSGSQAASDEEYASQFQCLPCPPGCDSCQSPSEEEFAGGDAGLELLRPCVVESDPLLRGVPLALQSFSITMCLILGVLVFRLRRTKVLACECLHVGMCVQYMSDAHQSLLWNRPELEAH